MALEFYDGFESYITDANLQKKWRSDSVGNLTSTGRYGGVFLLLTTLGSQQTTTSNLFANTQTRIVGFAIRFNGASTATFAFFQFMDSGSNQIEFRYTGATTQTLTLTRNGTAVGTGISGTYAPNVWHYFQIKATIHNTAGAVEIWANNVQVTNQTGINTRNTANAYSNMIRFNANAGMDVHIDDVYVLDTTGSDNNTFLGEVFTRYYPPTSDGIVNNFTRSTGSDNYSNVDDTDPNNDTDYVYSSTVGHKEMYVLAPINSNNAIVALQSQSVAKKTDIGARKYVDKYYQGGVYFNGSEQTPASDYVIVNEIMERSLMNGNLWNYWSLNTGQWGIEVTN